MEKKEFKNNIKLSLIAFIAATLLISGCQKSGTKSQGEYGQLSMSDEVNVEETEDNKLISEQTRSIIDETNRQLSEDKSLKAKEKQALDSEEEKLIRELLETHPDFSIEEVKETILGLRRNKDYYAENVLPELEEKLKEREELIARGELIVPTTIIGDVEEDVEKDAEGNEMNVLDLTEDNSGTWEFEPIAAGWREEEVHNAALIKCNNKKITEFNYDIVRMMIKGKPKLYRISYFKEFAFMGCKQLKEVSSKFVTKIKASAFLNCSNLESVNVSESIVEIGPSAFQNCKKLTSFNCENALWFTSSLINKVSEGIGNGAFYNCVAAKNICFAFTKDINTLSKYKQNLRYADSKAFKGCKFDTVGFLVDENASSELRSSLGKSICSYFSLGDKVDLHPIDIKPVVIKANNDLIDKIKNTKD
ncbi:MAG: leucine-rich repeat domain-containing protein [Oscillospiraceae bacterium]|nr:leucine-rich repeat domain-containing protein [Oscillospiraceae bacterium]